MDHHHIGLQPGMVAIHDYDPYWAMLFDQERELLERALGSLVVDIQHVGSTAVPGLPAKPIIDIAVGVVQLALVPSLIAPLETLAYRYHGEHGVAGRHFFSRGTPTTHHLHVIEVHSQRWLNMMLFRDYLRQHEHVLHHYASLKRTLALQFPDDRTSYQDGKGDFIISTIQQALAFYKAEH